MMRQARAALFPEVTGQFTRTRSRVGTLTAPPPVATAPLERNDARLVASTSFEIDFWGRFGRADEAARANLLGSQIAREVVGLTLGGVTAQTYFGLRSLDAQIVVLDNTIRLRRESLDIAHARASAGLASELDVHQAQGALSDALVQRREAGRQRALLERQLAQLSGRLDLKIAAGDLFALPVPPTPPAGLPSSLLERRPDIRAAEQTMVAANAQIGVARAARFPTVTLTGFLGGQSAAVEDIASSGVWGARPRHPRADLRRRPARGGRGPGRGALPADAGPLAALGRRRVPRSVRRARQPRGDRRLGSRPARARASRAQRARALAASATNPATRPTSKCSTRSAPPTTPRSPSCATARRASPSAST